MEVILQKPASYLGDGRQQQNVIFCDEILGILIEQVSFFAPRIMRFYPRLHLVNNDKTQAVEALSWTNIQQNESGKWFVLLDNESAICDLNKICSFIFNAKNISDEG